MNLLAVAHYLEALDWQRDVIRLHTIFGGKNPHPNFLVGGMASAINLDDTGTINTVRLSEIHGMITRAQRFVEQVYWPDLVAIAGFYKEWGAIGGGVPNFMSYGEFPEGDITDIGKLYFPRGIILNKDLTKVHPFEPEKIQEYINSSWYEYAGGDEAGLHPYEGETKAKYTGPPTPWTYLQGEKKYTWMKAPRYDGLPMQVGPLARMLVGFASGHEEIQETGEAGHGHPEGRPRRALLHPRPHRGARHGDGAAGPPDDTRGTTSWSTASGRATPRPSPRRSGSRPPGRRARPRGSAGWTPRAAHWATGCGSRTARSASTSAWCRAPGTARRGTLKGQMGPYEASLVDNHPLVRPDQPIEILRTIHSFDPCMACGVHVLDAEGNVVTEVKVQ